jgi:hypothetical protein
MFVPFAHLDTTMDILDLVNCIHQSALVFVLEKNLNFVMDHAYSGLCQPHPSIILVSGLLKNTKFVMNLLTVVFLKHIWFVKKLF